MPPPPSTPSTSYCESTPLRKASPDLENASTSVGAKKRGGSEYSCVYHVYRSSFEISYYTKCGRCVSSLVL